MSARSYWWSVVFCLLLGVPFAALADKYDVDAAAGRALVGNKVVKCSPSGGNGTVTVGEALRAIKPGDTLQLFPGNYESALVIGLDRIIVEGGEPEKYCNLKLEVGGKKCVIRNLWFNHLLMNQDTLILDSILNSAFTGYDNVKTECVLYNCCCRTLYIGDKRNTLAVIRSTVIQCAATCFAITSWDAGNFVFRDSVLYSRYIVFRVRGDPSIMIENSLIYGDNGLAKEDSFNAKKRGETALDISSFRKMTKSRTRGDNLADKPIFKRQSSWDPKKQIGFNDGNNQHWFYPNWSESEAPDFFMLTDDSPGKAQGYGANLNERGFPIPPPKPVLAAPVIPGKNNPPPAEPAPSPQPPPEQQPTKDPPPPPPAPPAP